MATSDEAYLFPTRTLEPYWEEEPVPPTFMDLDPDTSFEEDREIIDDLLDYLETLPISRGVNKTHIARKLVEEDDPSYQEISENLEASYSSVVKSANRMVERGLLDGEMIPTPQGNIIFQGINRYIDTLPRKEEMDVYSIDEEVSQIFSCVTKSRPQGERNSKLSAFLDFVSNPEKTVYDIHETWDNTGAKRYLEEWKEAGLAEMDEEKGMHMPTQKGLRAEGMLSYQFKELWLNREFLLDVAEHCRGDSFLEMEEYGEKGGFDPEWYGEHFGYFWWEEVLEDGIDLLGEQEIQP